MPYRQTNRGTKSRRGRPKNAYKSVRWHVVLKEEAAGPWDLLFYSPEHHGPAYGVKNELLNIVLKRLFEAYTSGQNTMDISDVRHLITTKVLEANTHES